MSAVLTKTTTTTTQPVIDLANEATAILVDEFSELYASIILKVERLEELKKKLGVIANKDKNDGPISLIGYEHTIDYTKPADVVTCSVDPKTFVETVGDWSALTISTTAARKRLTSEQMLLLFETKPGSRRFRRIRP